ncbi:4Fe-4S binding protein, partial [Candidatus Bathyarchaeota archaeon]|nr:4Fe-4S binding protein [Candidatus Bathyarchaeota archaeon]
RQTEAVIVDKEKCTACGRCVEACPGKIPYMHPTENYAVICDLCGGKPKCVEACAEGGWYALEIIKREDTPTFELFAKTPEEITRNVIRKLYGEEWEEAV